MILLNLKSKRIGRKWESLCSVKNFETVHSGSGFDEGMKSRLVKKNGK